MSLNTFKHKNVTLVGKWGKCNEIFTSEIVFPATIRVETIANSFLTVPCHHLVFQCPHDGCLVNLTLEIPKRKKGM